MSNNFMKSRASNLTILVESEIKHEIFNIAKTFSSNCLKRNLQDDDCFATTRGIDLQQYTIAFAIVYSTVQKF